MNGVLEVLGDLSSPVILLAVWVFTMLEGTLLVGLAVPGDVVVLFAASTVTDPAHFATMVAVVASGSLTGESLGYALGRRFGHRIRDSRVGRLVGEHRWSRAEEYLSRRGGRAVFAARFVAAVHTIVPVLAGTVRMSFRRFLGFSAAGSVVWSLAYVTAGTAAGASYREVAEHLGTGALVVGGALAGAAVFVSLIALRDAGTRLAAPLREILVAAAVVGVVTAGVSVVDEAGARAPDGLAYASAGAAGLALLGRRRWPLMVLAATATAFVVYHALGYAGGAPNPALWVALYCAAAAGHRCPALLVGGLVTGGGIVYRVLVEGEAMFAFSMVTEAALIALTVLLGDAMCSRRQPAGDGAGAPSLASMGRAPESRSRVT